MVSEERCENRMFYDLQPLSVFCSNDIFIPCYDMLSEHLAFLQVDSTGQRLTHKQQEWQAKASSFICLAWIELCHSLLEPASYHQPNNTSLFLTSPIFCVYLSITNLNKIF